MVGYEATFDMPGIAGPDDVEPGFGVFVPGMGGLRLAGRVAENLAQANARPTPSTSDTAPGKAL
jgi:hypothetical protein